MARGLRERLADGVVLGDGGYLLELEKRGYVQAGPFTPEVVIEHPDALAQLHREFLRAGVDVLQTMTFYASDDKLATVGMEGKVDEINRNAVQVAREVADEGDALVAGNLSLTWAYDPADPKAVDHTRALFDRQLQDQIDAGPARLLDRRDVRLAGRGAAVRRAREGDRPAGDGDDVVREARAARLRGRDAGRGGEEAGRRRRRRRRRELPERARADAADRGRDGRRRRHAGRRPARRVPHQQGQARLHVVGELPVRARLDAGATAARWPTSRSPRATPACGTSAAAAARWPATCARWRGRSASSPPRSASGGRRRASRCRATSTTTTRRPSRAP